MFSALFIAFILIVVIQIGYYGILFSPFSFAKTLSVQRNVSPVSVILACRNEAENLKSILPKLLIQDHPNFEIVVVNDASTDETISILDSFSRQSKKITILNIPISDTYLGNKKNALTKAIQVAQYENLLFTDADCVPASNSWITEMGNQFTKEKQLILGYGAYKKLSGWLNKVIRYETLLTAWQYFSYAKIGVPYMGVGRNIGYTKSLFKKIEGFRSHQNIKSGDDDLFVNQAGTANNIALCWQTEAHTVSAPKESLSEWLRQKRRHITTATSYKPMHQFMLGLFYFSQVLFYVFFLGLLFSGYQVELVLTLASIRFVFFFISLILTANKLNENDLIKYAPILELYLIVMQMRIFISNLWNKPEAW